MLIAIDGSESSLHAFKESMKLADTEKSWITAVCVTPPYEGDLEVMGIGDIREAMSRPCLDTIEKATAIADAQNRHVKFIHENGRFHERIIDVAEEYNCELIVMGRHGHHGLSRTLIGSVATRVIGFSQRDVLIVPKESAIGWGNVLVATDGSEFSERAVDRAIDFTASYEGKLNVVSAVDVPVEAYGEAPEAIDRMVEKAREIVDTAVNKAKAAGIMAEGHVRTGDSAEIILELAEKLSAETIFMSSLGKTGLTRLLLGSVAEKVIGLSHCPVLIAK